MQNFKCKTRSRLPGTNSEKHPNGATIAGLVLELGQASCHGLADAFTQRAMRTQSASAIVSLNIIQNREVSCQASSIKHRAHGHGQNWVAMNACTHAELRISGKPLPLPLPQRLWPLHSGKGVDTTTAQLLQQTSTQSNREINFLLSAFVSSSARALDQHSDEAEKVLYRCQTSDCQQQKPALQRPGGEFESTLYETSFCCPILVLSIEQRVNRIAMHARGADLSLDTTEP